MVNQYWSDTTIILHDLNISFSERSTEKEWMELPETRQEDVNATLRYIHFTNRVLGGYSTLFRGLDTITSSEPEREVWRILDLGCGDGQQLEVMASWARRRGLNVRLYGLDIDRQSIARAQQNPNLSGIEFIHADATDSAFDYNDWDIVTGTLFFHHLSTDHIAEILSKCNNAGVAVLFNDLQRSRLAFRLFRLFATVTMAPGMARHDGALSVMRSFKRAELEQLAKRSGYEIYTLEWRWAFRYLLTLQHG